MEGLRFKKWHPDSVLYLSDFRKTGPLFRTDGFDAEIATAIMVNKSEEGTVYAFPVMDRFRSWYNEDNHSVHLLNHEAYHANITAIGVKLLNQKIEEQNLSYKEAINERERIEKEIISLHDEYDLSTNHSMNEPMQHYWEYKIDSILNHGTKLDTIDIFSGATAYFPDQPEVFVQKDTFMLFKVFQLEKYKMKFRFITKYDQYIDSTNYEEDFVNFLTTLNFTDISSNQSEFNGRLMIETHCSDTVNNRRFHDRIFYDDNHEYQLTVFHPLSSQNDSIYKKLTSQFFESFAIKNLENYWKEKVGNSKPKEIEDVTVPENAIGDFKTFTTLPYSDCAITYHSPIVFEDELIIPFKSERHKTEDIDKIMVIVNNEKIFSQEVGSVNQLIHLKLSELKEPKNKIQFGYTLKRDSINETSHLYSSIISGYTKPSRSLSPKVK